MNSKEQFLSDKQLHEWWAVISKDARFDKVLLHAAGCALESCPSAEQRAGVLAFKEILLTLSDVNSEPILFPTTGLSHNLEPKSRTLKPKAK